MTAKDRAQLRNEFLAFDTQNTGTITHLQVRLPWQLTLEWTYKVMAESKKEATQSMRINVYKWYKCHLKNMKDVSRCEMMADLSTQYIITDERWLKYLPHVISGGFCFRPLQVWKVMYPSFERCHALGFSGNSCCSVNSRHLRKDFVNAFKGFLHMFGSKSPRTYRVRPPKLVCEPIKYSDISGPPKLSEL